MKNILFDIETNGLLDELDRVHSLVMIDMDTGDIVSCADQEGYTPIEVGIKTLMDADLLVVTTSKHSTSLQLRKCMGCN